MFASDTAEEFTGLVHGTGIETLSSLPWTLSTLADQRSLLVPPARSLPDWRIWNWVVRSIPSVKYSPCPKPSSRHLHNWKSRQNFFLSTYRNHDPQDTPKMMGRRMIMGPNTHTKKKSRLGNQKNTQTRIHTYMRACSIPHIYKGGCLSKVCSKYSLLGCNNNGYSGNHLLLHKRVAFFLFGLPHWTAKQK